ncbi:hypothetical protein SAMN05216316_3145 [Nitrosovibrio sp. Nv6]|nr:hypothetical protein SAMN05216316_3145 [Nitrosovibrio sp. Nv6]
MQRYNGAILPVLGDPTPQADKLLSFITINSGRGTLGMG